MSTYYAVSDALLTVSPAIVVDGIRSQNPVGLGIPSESSGIKIYPNGKTTDTATTAAAAATATSTDEVLHFRKSLYNRWDATEMSNVRGYFSISISSDLIHGYTF